MPQWKQKWPSMATPTRDELLTYETESTVLEKVYDEAVKDVTVSEEELQEAYNTHVESAMTTYGNSPSQLRHRRAERLDHLLRARRLPLRQAHPD